MPSSNWLALQKTMNKSHSNPKKRRKLSHTTTSPPTLAPSTSTATTPPNDPETIHETGEDGTNNSKTALRKMVTGKLDYTLSQCLPGRYLALDCEMVGIGVNGAESSVARVSLVNWHGAVQLDVFVRQREKVVDYRTQWSGIRAKDLVKARPFAEVQKQVADMIKDRILVGHAIHNDLRVLLLSHPHASVRDTQIYAHKFHLTKSNRIALRNLVKEQLGLTIQEGEHNSVTDARATMAIYRLHKKEWEKGATSSPSTQTVAHNSKKRKRDSLKGKDRTEESDNNRPDLEVQPKARPTPQRRSKSKGKARLERKGVSSGLSTVTTRRGAVTERIIGGARAKGGSDSEGKKAWWTDLPSSNRAPGGSKGAIRLKTVPS